MNEFPSFNLNCLLYSEYDNLDVRINKSDEYKIEDDRLNSDSYTEYVGSYELSLIENT